MLVWHSTRQSRPGAVEALAHRQHPERGLLAPIAFLDITEDLKVVTKIDRTILEQAIGRVHEQNASRIRSPKISVKVSLKRLTDPDLLKGLDIQDIDLSFELLETIFLDEQNDYFDWCIDQLQERGVEIEIGDFGSGRASIVGLTPRLSA